MISFDKGAAFDPGFAPFVFGFSHNVIMADREISQLASLHQKKFKYKILYPQLTKLMKNSIAFYQGCLMWAYSLSKKFQDAPIEITGNFSLGKNPDEYDYLAEINYLIEYFNKIEKDCKYFLSQSANVSEYWKKIAYTYKEFLQLNNNFVSTKTTNDIVLPKVIEDLKIEPDDFISQIEKAIDNGNIELLLGAEII